MLPQGPPQISYTKLIDEAKIAKRVAELGAEITKIAAKEPMVVIGVLKGSFIFFSDLTRQIDADITTQFLGVSSYGNATTSSGEVRMTMDLTNSIAGKTVLLVEDIVDTGLTLAYLTEILKPRKPKKILSACLLFKKAALKVNIKPDFYGFEIGDEFVVGYGLDYQEYFRNLPFVASLNNLN